MNDEKRNLIPLSRTRKVEPTRDDWFTIKENKFLEVLKRFKRVKPTALELHITYRRAERILANIRRKWNLSVNTNNRLVSLCRRDSAMRKLLSMPARREPEMQSFREEWEEEWEEEED